VNLLEVDFVIKDGERICQMVITKHEKAAWITIGDLTETEHGEGGFELTGKK